MSTSMPVTYANSVSELVRRRFSCRNYGEIAITGETRARLVDYLAAGTRGPFGTQARFGLVAATQEDRQALRKLGTYGFIKGATGFIIGAMPRVHSTLEDFGYLMERIILFATDLGLGTCWLGGTFTKSSFAEKISASEDELVPAVVSVGYMAEKPRWIETVLRKGDGTDRRLPWEQLFFDGSFAVPLSRRAAGDFTLPLDMVRLAPSASNQQPWRILRDGKAWHFYLQRTPGYRERTLVRLFTVADLQRIDMGIAMCHFEMMAGELGLSGHWETDEPAIEKPDTSTEFTASWVS